jgi:poly-gamma-glutamate synthesis protein (capsule biosynthesis protein)
VASTIGAADLAVCHLEGPIGGPGQRVGRFGRKNSRGWRMLGPYEVAAAIEATGFDRCTTASNHSWDMGVAGIASSLAALDDAGISHTGTARTPEEAAPVLLSVNGITVAHLSYTNTTNTRLPKETWRVAWGNADRVVADVAAVRAAGADVVILSVHMGAEGRNKPDRRQRAWADEVTRRADIDLVVMHGPHAVQPIEEVNGTWVFWSVGNFLTGMGGGSHPIYGAPRMLDGLIAQARFEEDPQHPGRFLTTVGSRASCVDPRTRTVHVATVGLADPDIDKRLRTVLSACLQRTTRIVPDVG